MKSIFKKSFKDIIQNIFGEQSSILIEAFKNGVENGESGDALKTHLLGSLGEGLSDAKVRILDTICDRTWVTHGQPPQLK
ncbi:MAG: hypothetical protein ACXABO_13345 [Promethearchaeota archaeon]|jgi:hypothetical protein